MSSNLYKEALHKFMQGEHMDIKVIFPQLSTEDKNKLLTYFRKYWEYVHDSENFKDMMKVILEEPSWKKVKEWIGDTTNQFFDPSEEVND